MFPGKNDILRMLWYSGDKICERVKIWLCKVVNFGRSAWNKDFGRFKTTFYILVSFGIPYTCKILT